MSFMTAISRSTFLRKFGFEVNNVLVIIFMATFWPVSLWMANLTLPSMMMIVSYTVNILPVAPSPRVGPKIKGPILSSAFVDDMVLLLFFCLFENKRDNVLNYKGTQRQVFARPWTTWSKKIQRYHTCSEVASGMIGICLALLYTPWILCHCHVNCSQKNQSFFNLVSRVQSHTNKGQAFL